MSYEEILEKIRRAKALADSKKAGSHTDNTDASKSDKTIKTFKILKMQDNGS